MRMSFLIRYCVLLIFFLTPFFESSLFAASKDGRIERVEGKYAIISLGHYDGVKQGLEGEIFRDEFVTGQLITSKLGEFVVTDVFPDSSRIEILMKFAVVEQYDKVRVENVNSPPELMRIGDQTVYEDSLLSIIVSAQDPDGDDLVFSALDLPPGSSFTPSGGQFLWTPAFHQSGTYSVRFGVSDGMLEDYEDVTIHVKDLSPDEADTGKSAVASLLTNKWFWIAVPVVGGSAAYLVWGRDGGSGPDDGVIYIRVIFP